MPKQASQLIWRECFDSLERFIIKKMKILRTLLASVVLLVPAFAQVPNVISSLKLASTVAKPGSIVKGTITIQIPAGHHAYARPATESGQVLLTITSAADTKARISKVSYPKGVSKKYPGMDATLNVYEGKIVVPVEFKMPANVGRVTLTVNVLTQICTNDTGQCFAPNTKKLAASLLLKK